MKAIISAFLLAISPVAISTVHAVSSHQELKPADHKALGFEFVITHKRLPDGTTEFRVVITEVSAKFDKYTHVDLATVQITERSSEVRQARHLDPQREGNSLVCTFVLETV